MVSNYNLRMNLNFLDFEQPIAELEARIQELKYVDDDSAVNLSDEIARLKNKSESLTESIFASLTSWQQVQLARHPQRLYTQDYIDGLITDFSELHGDRAFADDPAIVGGIGRFEGQSVMIIGQQKGRDTQEKIKRNFGMPRPEGYRKALRLMHMAERFQMPILTFIDTPGAYPGIDAEERGQSEAIARNLFEMSKLRTPIIATVIGEGGSGGALAIGVADEVAMLQYSVYSVISPEGCASILWKDAAKAPDASEAMAMTSGRLHDLGLIDTIIPEPLGGAHRNTQEMLSNMRQHISSALGRLTSLDLDQLVNKRYDKIMEYGEFEG